MMNLPIGLGGPRPPSTLRLPRLRSGEAEPVPAEGAVLIVDDDWDVREELAGALGRRGLQVVSAGSTEAALDLLRRRPDVAVLVTDIRMPGTDGLALAETALRGRSQAQALEVVLVTGYASAAQGMAAARLGAFGTLHKPMRASELARMVQDALARAALRRAAVAAEAWQEAEQAAEQSAEPGAPSAPAWLAGAPEASWPPRRASGTIHAPIAWTRRPTASGLLAPIPDPQPRQASPAPPRAEPAAWAQELPLSPCRAAEALLRTLAQRLDPAGNGIEGIARDLHGPLGDLLRAAPRPPVKAGAPRRLLHLLDELMDLVALQAGVAQPRRAPVSPQRLLDRVAEALAALGLACDRPAVLQAEPERAFLLDDERLARAMALLGGTTLGGAAGGRAELALEAAGGQARLDLLIASGATQPGEEAEAARRLALAIARRLAALQGGRLDAWRMPKGGLRARLLIRGC
ncbi:response regulator [Falsiroseomonas tokyonensis]|uniref:Response regulator n=1 Tax=Falsiroseomonas tokyonensis TaxID=430521 RepID=A0ABV7BZM4_9PROT|nr:response regulator [Falsiroseomonas tokyonensis]MBU8539854.1 response regulator [Falsiroseomonas tokyonensis]